MQTPQNRFKQALRQGQAQIGLWMNLADPYAAEMCACAGFDWLLIDGEHSPNDLRSTLGALQAIAPYPTQSVVRIPMGHGHVGQALIKQNLDIGAQTLLVPMVDTAEQAATLVQSLRYPPLGVRGMGGARASHWGHNPRYAVEANEQVCLLVQAETTTALENLDAIAATEGVDGVFIGPADLSASMGHVGNPGHPQVQAAIADAIARILKAGKAPGILSPDEELCRGYLAQGALFVAVGLDTNLLVRHTAALAARFKSVVQAPAASSTY